MHEVSLMKNLLDIVEKTARNKGASRISVVHMKIGEMSGVNTESLNFAFEVLSEGTVASGGRLEFERIPLRVRCGDCGTESHLEEFIFRCRKCGSGRIDVISGREIEVDYILTKDSDDEYGGKPLS